jgi:hypothetical protein
MPDGCAFRPGRRAPTRSNPATHNPIVPVWEVYCPDRQARSQWLPDKQWAFPLRREAAGFRESTTKHDRLAGYHGANEAKVSSAQRIRHLLTGVIRPAA